MPARSKDWLRQARRDLDQARHAAEGGFFEWACFSAQQAAEKAVKGLYQQLGADAWGHSVSALLRSLPADARPSGPLMDAAKRLDRHYIPPRYPNSVPEGAPGDYYTADEAQAAIEDAEKIVGFCEDHVF